MTSVTILVYGDMHEDISISACVPRVIGQPTTIFHQGIDNVSAPLTVSQSTTNHAHSLPWRR